MIANEMNTVFAQIDSSLDKIGAELDECSVIIRETTETLDDMSRDLTIINQWLTAFAVAAGLAILAGLIASLAMA